MSTDPILTKGTEATPAIVARVYTDPNGAGGVPDVARQGDTVTVAVVPTQVRRPWRSTVRTLFQALVGIAVMAPAVYQAATNSDPALATGAAGVGLAIAGGVARVMAMPQVDQFLSRFLPFLSTTGKA